MNEHNELFTTYTFNKISIYYDTDNSIIVDFCDKDEVLYTLGGMRVNFSTGDTLHLVGIDGKITVNSSAN